MHGEPNIKCENCLDTGLVEEWDGRSYDGSIPDGAAVRPVPCAMCNSNNRAIFFDYEAHADYCEVVDCPTCREGYDEVEAILRRSGGEPNE